MNLIRSVEIFITTWAEEAGEATKLEYYASDIEKVWHVFRQVSQPHIDIEKCTVDKVAVFAKGEAALSV